MITTTVTPEELHVLRHSLGIRKRGQDWTKPYRNHFIINNGATLFPTLQGLVSRGLMTVSGVGSGYAIFRVTEAGKTIAAVTDPMEEARG